MPERRAYRNGHAQGLDRCPFPALRCQATSKTYESSVMGAIAARTILLARAPTDAGIGEEEE